MTERDLEVIALLGSIYPAWRFQVADAPGVARWWAHLHRPVTTTEHTAGARTSIGRTTPERLAAALARHAEILGGQRRYREAEVNALRNGG
ncbi:hypothetical protein AB0395_22615 [Streptosporangium sp. NPDC051023]|uniref:hypothetical protein n=1 Tax=Streptosporangium sp. NPDC051023 TaxID=3155410 RepID=UPI00344DD2F6